MMQNELAEENGKGKQLTGLVSAGWFGVWPKKFEPAELKYRAQPW
jgi:hypothetical protein